MLSRVLSVLCSFFLAACAFYDFPDPTPEDFAVHGIDVSRYQGDINWLAAKNGGVEFAFIKATEGGDHSDPRFLDYWYAAKAAGIPRGAYHFYYFCRTGAEQAAWFIQNVPNEEDALPPVLDMEWNGHSKTCKKQPSKDEVIREMAVFLKTVEDHYGKKPIIYSSVDFHRDRLEGEKHGYDFWLRSVASHPSRKYDGRDNWLFWQYTAEGQVAGIGGNVDRNVFYGTKSQWRNYLEQKKVTRTASN